MTERTTPRSDRATFDQLCEQIDEYEPIPAPSGENAVPALDPEEGAVGATLSDAAHGASIDAAILAGLVSP